jgi:pyruvate formate lyase activating enzyme
LLIYGIIASENNDPISKKPIYNFLPNSMTYSIGTVGCNFKCDFCQNFEISQSKKIIGRKLCAKEIVERALRCGAKSISYTYNEPTIFAEFFKDVAELAKLKGLKNILVTNGYFSEECFELVFPFIDAMNIDLKSFNEDFYRKNCKAKLNYVLGNIKKVYDKGIHVEITTLIIPGLNDSEEEFEKIAKFISSIDKNIPWHISRFFPRYKMKDKKITDLETLKKAENIGRKYLNYVYVGNI